MAWIKRNLVFVITVVAGLGLTGYCGYLLYAALSQNAAASEQYASAKSNLEQLQQKTPFPSKENIQAAESDAQRARAFLGEFRKCFATFATPPTVGDREFNEYLQKSISRFGTEATNAGVGLPFGYAFSFSQQIGKLDYPAGCIAPWMQELEEIQAILHILWNAKINYLETIKRPSVGPEDIGGDDYIQFNTVTNQWGVVTPYLVNFRAFSTEIANVLAGIAASSNCFIVKTIYVTPSKVPLPQGAELQPTPAPVMRYLQPQPLPQPEFNRFMGPMGRGRGEGRGGYGMERRPMMPMQPAPMMMAPAAPTGPVTILTETPLFVTLYIDVVKLKPEATAGAAKPAMAER